MPRTGAHAGVAERPDTVTPTCLAHRFRELLRLPAAGVSGEAGVFTVEEPFGVLYYATYEVSGRLSCDEATQKVLAARRVSMTRMRAVVSHTRSTAALGVMKSKSI